MNDKFTIINLLIFIIMAKLKEKECKGLYGFEDENGNEIVPCKYGYVGNFYQGMSRVYKGGKFGFVDESGKEVIPCEYDYACNFEEDGLAEVLRDDKVWVYIDKDGNFVKENENDEEKVNFFDYFFEDGGERIYAMYDYDKEEDCFQRDVIIDLEDRDEDLIEEIIEIFHSECDMREIEIDVDDLEFTKSEITRFIDKYNISYKADGDYYEKTFKGVPVMILSCLGNSIYRTQLDDWVEDNAIIDFGSFNLYLDIETD